MSYDITVGLECEPSSGLLGCLRAHEHSDTSAPADTVFRRGKRLCLPVLPEPVCFDDRQTLAYTLVGREENQYLVVETDSTGGYEVIMVDSTDGSQLRVDNRPLRSGHSRLFATVSYDTDSGYVPNRVVVWNAGQSNPVYEFHDFSPGEGPTSIRWLGPSKLEVRYNREPSLPGRHVPDIFFVWKDRQGVWGNNYKR